MFYDGESAIRGRIRVPRRAKNRSVPWSTIKRPELWGQLSAETIGFSHLPIQGRNGSLKWIQS